MAELERLGPRLRLDEPTLSHEWIRFDAPGDFQLMPSRGLLRDRRLRRGDAPRLARRLEPQPADVAPPRLDRDPRGPARRLPLQPQPHANRLPGRSSRRERLRPVLLLRRAGRASGAAGDLGPRRRPRSRRSRSARLGGIAIRRARSSTAIPRRESRAVATTDVDCGVRAHATTPATSLPFVADSIAVSPPGATIGYLGANPMLERMLGRSRSSSTAG